MPSSPALMPRSREADREGCFLWRLHSLLPRSAGGFASARLVDRKTEALPWMSSKRFLDPSSRRCASTRAAKASAFRTGAASGVRSGLPSPGLGSEAPAFFASLSAEGAARLPCPRLASLRRRLRRFSEKAAITQAAVRMRFGLKATIASLLAVRADGVNNTERARGPRSAWYKDRRCLLSRQSISRGMEEAYRWRVEVLAHPMVPLLVAVDEDERLCRVSLGAEREAIERDAERRGALVEKRRGVASDAARQLSEYLEGKRRHFDLELETGGTEFERAAWRALCEIPFGETKSYGEQAALLDRPGAARAVGESERQEPHPHRRPLPPGDAERTVASPVSQAACPSSVGSWHTKAGSYPYFDGRSRISSKSDRQLDRRRGGIGGDSVLCVRAARCVADRSSLRRRNAAPDGAVDPPLLGAGELGRRSGRGGDRYQGIEIFRLFGARAHVVFLFWAWRSCASTARRWHR